MSKQLHKVYGSPLEREFEAWIVAEIEEYFRQLGAFCAVFAIGPSEEVHWPADEAVYAGTKLFGLQFKQAKIAQPTKAKPGQASKRTAPDRLKWSLHQPLGQYELVELTPEIFYCLPTFVNRNFRRNSLHHCLFWRPGKTKDKNLWYDNPNSNSPYNQLKGADRWGLFIEEIFNCKYGLSIDSRQEAITFTRRIQINMRERTALQAPDAEGEHIADAAGSEFGLYMLLVNRQN